MIAKFPSFSPIDTAHQEAVQALTNQFESYSDFNFVSLFCWDTEGLTKLSTLKDNLIIELADYLDGTPNVSILGQTDINNVLLEVLHTFNELALVPEVVVRQITSPEKFEVTEDRNNFDYLYDTHELSSLAGKEYKKKRNQLSKLHGDLGQSLSVITHNKINTSRAEEYQSIFRTWQAGKADPDLADSESKAFSRLLKHSEAFNLCFTEVRIDGALHAISIHEIIQADFALCHFEKALPTHPYLYTYLVQQAATELLRMGCTTVNWEQDLGITGLRKSKLSYRPKRYLKKYSIKLADFS